MQTEGCRQAYMLCAHILHVLFLFSRCRCVFVCMYRETTCCDGGYAGLKLETGIWIARTNLYQYIYMSRIHTYIVCVHIHCMCVCVHVCMDIYVYESMYVFDLVCIRCTHVLHIFDTSVYTCRYVCCSYQPLLASIYIHTWCESVFVCICVYVCAYILQVHIL